MRTLNDEGITNLKQWEGVKLKAYKDSGGVWTIGVGHTSDKNYVVTSTSVISVAKAEELLRLDLVETYEAIAKLVKVKLTDNQYTVISSFIFNIGEPKFKTSTLLKKLNKGDYDAVPVELMKWVNDDGRRVQGLVNRRAQEAAYWGKGEFVTSKDVQPSKPKTVTGSTVAVAGAGGVSGAIVVAKGAIDATGETVGKLNETVSQNPDLFHNPYLLVVLGVVVVVSVGAFLYFRHKDNS